MLIALVRAFEACTLPSAAWMHPTQLSEAFWYLDNYPLVEATRLIRYGIQRFNAVHNKGLAYHETITLIWIEVISRFLDDQNDEWLRA